MYWSQEGVGGDSDGDKRDAKRGSYFILVCPNPMIPPHYTHFSF
jgi:hypothetical protein